jgi:lipid II:glycine glycyltransferase (peptidoglycan interpeptide bridge formation enzyme)
MWKFLRQSPINHSTNRPIAHLLTATYDKEIITTWILFEWRDFLYYPYGASTEQHKNVMANNLMMWEAIKFGKKMGLKTFDLWGREEGKGFTKFKEGYNPKVVEFLGTWDLIINKPMYRLYKAGERVRWPALKLAAKFGLSKARF